MFITVEAIGEEGGYVEIESIVRDGNGFILCTTVVDCCEAPPLESVEIIGTVLSGPQGEKGDQGETGPQGPQGEKGDTGSEVLSYTAGENLSAGRIVVKSSGKVYYFNPNDLDHIGKNLGVTITSALLDEVVNVQFNGSITDASFDFEPDRPLYVGVNGQMFTTVQDVLIIQRAGVSVETNKIIIDFFLPIIKT